MKERKTCFGVTPKELKKVKKQNKLSFNISGYTLTISLTKNKVSN